MITNKLSTFQASLKRPFFKFLISGGFNTLVTYGLYRIFLLCFDYQISYTIAYVAGIILSFILNRFFVFQQAVSTAAAFSWPLVYVAQYLFGMAVSWLWVGYFSLSDEYSPIIVVMLSVPLTFFLSHFVFTKRK